MVLRRIFVPVPSLDVFVLSFVFLRAFVVSCGEAAA